MNEQICPVCRRNLDEDAQNVTVEGKTFRVCCEECAKTLRENPARYAAKATTGTP